MSKYKLFCPEHYEEIENYDLALKDNFIGWTCHHRNGEEFSVEWLKANNMYYNRKDPHEFKFMRNAEHKSLHSKGKKFTDEHKEKIRKSRMGHKDNKGAIHSKFGEMFKEKYGMTMTDDIKFYKRESKYFHKHGVCRWQNE
jgi:hypothetical protein